MKAWLKKLTDAAAGGDRKAARVLALHEGGARSDLRRRLERLERGSARTATEGDRGEDWKSSLAAAAAGWDREALTTLRRRAGAGDVWAVAALQKMGEPVSEDVASSPRLRASLGFRPLPSRDTGVRHAMPRVMPSALRGAR